MNQPFPPMPGRIAKLPRDHRGFPIPWFVAVQPDGTRDFRVADGHKNELAVRNKLCWVCGEHLGRFLSFVIGPMCVVNRCTAEPPCHLDCAEFSATACPFLIRPRMRRNENDLPDGHTVPPGQFITRNPGVACVYTTLSYRRFDAMGSGKLIKLGEPTSVRWFAESKPASREEVMASIDSGYPLLLDMARKDGAEAIEELEFLMERAMSLLPPEEAA